MCIKGTKYVFAVSVHARYVKHGEQFLNMYCLIFFPGSQRKERKSAAGQNKSPKRPRSDSGDTMNNGVDSSPTPAKVCLLIFIS